MRKQIAVLCAHSKSHYKQIPICDVYDSERDANTFTGTLPVVAHAPCSPWSRLRKFAKVRPGQAELAHFCLDAVRSNGGVFEHPSGSHFWKARNLPRPGQRDDFGICVSVPQFWFGHKAQKNTLLYIVGVDFCELPEIPYYLGTATKTVSDHLSKKERELTPYPFAEFLIEIAHKAGRKAPLFTAA